MEGTPGAQELHLVVGSHGLGQLEADLEITTHETERSHKIWVEVEVQAVVGGGGGAGGGGWRWSWNGSISPSCGVTGEMVRDQVARQASYTWPQPGHSLATAWPLPGHRGIHTC